jgi:hypothetical protein
MRTLLVVVQGIEMQHPLEVPLTEHDAGNLGV